MNATTRLLTTVSVTNVFCRNIHSALLHHELKIVHMTEVPLKYLLLKNLRKSASAPEALYSTYVNLVDSMSSSGTHQEFSKAIMEPYMDSCFIQKDVPSKSTYDFAIESSSSADASNESITAIFTQEMDIKKSAKDDESLESRCLRSIQKYKAMRKWKRFGKQKQKVNSNDEFVLRLVSFNILAQSLLESHAYLYKNHDKEALPWKVRKTLIIQELLQTEANVICLQEMQEEHLNDFLIPFKEKGYDYLYKKRTNDKDDGLLLMYRSDQLVVLDYVKVEMYQSEIELLSRDNVALVVKFALKESRETQVVIATTHLLYNPRRNDVRLGQVQILLAEIERISFLENSMTGPKYLPIILCGDFNLEPQTGVYKFITEGSFTFMRKGRNLEVQDYRYLTNMLIPPRLYITDGCQHFNILFQRIHKKGKGQVALENKEHRLKLEDKASDEVPEKLRVDTGSSDSQQIEIDEKTKVTFNSGTLSHPFRFRSVYKHVNRHGELEATTNQERWITVDYIFFAEVEPLQKYTLPTVEQCKTLPKIPNLAVGSDHLCLAASFKLQKKKRANL